MKYDFVAYQNRAEELERCYDRWKEREDNFRQELAEREARIAELEAALKPYTNGVVLPGAPDEQGVIVSMTVGDLRRARAAYMGETKE